MHDAVGPRLLDRRDEPLAVGQVGKCGLGARRVRALAADQRDDLVAPLAQTPADDPSDEAARAGDQDPHRAQTNRVTRAR